MLENEGNVASLALPLPKMSLIPRAEQAEEPRPPQCQISDGTGAAISDTSSDSKGPFLLDVGRRAKEAMLENEGNVVSLALLLPKTSLVPSAEKAEESRPPQYQISDGRGAAISDTSSGNPRRKYFCPECGRCFAFRLALARHQIIHTGEKIQENSERGNCLGQSLELANHPGSPKYSEFRKVLAHQPIVLIHRNIHAGGDISYRCLECGEGFSQLRFCET
ncbi:zinc finger and SCAN domain-containing protein 20-like isoform X5 [Zootoca vivipara]|uniref:zinc finger and SCAN domain-containing protein 20-like isoform X5 n=1 Tax=Zootoca vivipara TaxID=8524 RepID=UPI00293C0E29|nr:zinc finger and SCAN domain-containing protein 20-like isoform X5 [Zootoca vivipara]